MLGAPKKQPPRRRLAGPQSRLQVEKVREGVYARDGGLCAAQGRTRWPCRGGLSIQHARNRGMGGSAAFDGFEWLRTMCLGHNVLATADAEFSRLALRYGWQVPGHGFDWFDMTALPVRVPDGWFRFDRDGGRVRLGADRLVPPWLE